jgi:DNA (cytosine-5)-methyltransferase 3A
MSTKDEQQILTLEHYLQLKSEGFEFEGQSYLFWEYMRLLNECNPKYFLLENVEMGEKWEKVLSKAIGVNGIHINSALVSAQNRKRIYWTNIGLKPGGLFGDLVSIIQKPKDKGILLKDVLENEVNEKYFLSDKTIATITRHGNKIIDEKENPNQSCTIHANYFKMGGRDQQYIIHNTMPRSSTSGKGGTGPLSRADGKTYCLDTGNTNAVEIVAMRGRPNQNGINVQQLESRDDNKTNCLTSVQKDNLVLGCDYRSDEGIRIRRNGKSPTLTRGAESSGTQYNNLALINNNIRRLTPLECERLQTVPDNYTNHVSDSQRYKMLGNGWTIDIISHIFKYL